MSFRFLSKSSSLLRLPLLSTTIVRKIRPFTSVKYIHSSSSSFPSSTPHLFATSNVHQIADDPIPSSQSLTTTVNITHDGKINITYPDSTVLSLHNIWLRDHCRSPLCYHPITKQRLVDTAKLDLSIKPIQMHLDHKNILSINWSDNHQSQYDTNWLRKVFLTHPEDLLQKQTAHLKLWGAELKKNLPFVTYDHVMSNDKKGLATWLTHVRDYGIGFVHGVPADSKKSEELCRKIAFIRETHYGSFWDFTSNLEHGDTAYTSIALPAHTDTTYFTDPIGLQVFHLIEHRGVGGTSLMVDGFKCAQILKQEHPDSYHTLSTLRVPTACAGDASVFIRSTQYGHPILNHHPVFGHLYQIRYNNDDRSVLSRLSPGEVVKFYKALQNWMRILRDPMNELWIQLRPDQVVCLDNWRVLHGRAAFTGYRRMLGCYINRDDYESQLRVLCDENQEKEFI